MFVVIICDIFLVLNLMQINRFLFVQSIIFKEYYQKKHFIQIFITILLILGLLFYFFSMR